MTAKRGYILTFDKISILFKNIEPLMQSQVTIISSYLFTWAHITMIITSAQSQRDQIDATPLLWGPSARHSEWHSRDTGTNIPPSLSRDKIGQLWRWRAWYRYEMHAEGSPSYELAKQCAELRSPNDLMSCTIPYFLRFIWLAPTLPTSTSPRSLPPPVQDVPSPLQSPSNNDDDIFESFFPDEHFIDV